MRRKDGIMATEKADRRVKYTKTLLKDALVDLMQSKHISGITVKAICERADVNRSTFYAHYSDQYDLLHQVEQEVLRTLRERLEEGLDYQDGYPVSRQIMKYILEYVKENTGLCKVLLSENCDFAFQKDIVELSQIVSFDLNPAYGARTQDYLMIYGISGCISIFEKWLQDSTVESTEEISELLLQVLYNGILSFSAKG
jgi:AcrR family transcriptional regulator